MYFWFYDDVTFGRNGCDAERWRLHCVATAINDVAIVGRSLMSMNACSICILYTLSRTCMLAVNIGK